MHVSLFIIFLFSWFFFFLKQKTAYEMRISDWSSDVCSSDLASLRSQIAIVQQEPILFHRTLAENIAYARPGASRAHVMQAARLASAHDFIMALPNEIGRASCRDRVCQYV